MISATPHMEIDNGGEYECSLATSGHCGYCYGGFPVLCQLGREADDALWEAHDRVMDELEAELATSKDEFLAVDDEELRVALEEAERDACGADT